MCDVELRAHMRRQKWDSCVGLCALRTRHGAGSAHAMVSDPPVFMPQPFDGLLGFAPLPLTAVLHCSCRAYGCRVVAERARVLHLVCACLGFSVS